MEDRGAYLIIGSTDEGSSFEIYSRASSKVEARLIHFFKLMIVHMQDL